MEGNKKSFNMLHLRSLPPPVESVVAAVTLRSRQECSVRVEMQVRAGGKGDVTRERKEDVRSEES